LTIKPRALPWAIICRAWTHSLQLARPSWAFGSAEFLSPFPEGLKSALLNQRLSAVKRFAFSAFSCGNPNPCPPAVLAPVAAGRCSSVVEILCKVSRPAPKWAS
jgi:hypothetical protein